MSRSSPFCTADILKFGIPKPLAGFFNTQSVLGTLSASKRPSCPFEPFRRARVALGGALHAYLSYCTGTVEKNCRDLI